MIPSEVRPMVERMAAADLSWAPLRTKRSDLVAELKIPTTRREMK